jgi:GT2 family glycosyltransferase
MFSMKILTVILNYNGGEETLACLRAFAKMSLTSDVYLVENSDRDKENEIKLFREFFAKNPTFPLAKFDIQAQNTGFAGGVNLGISYALREKYDAVALLNSDAIPDKNWLKNLAKNLPEYDAATGLMIDSAGDKIINTGDIFTMWGLPEQRDENLPVASASKSGEVFGATGGAVLYKTEIFRQPDDGKAAADGLGIGLFDEKLFAYDEDVDIAWRARLAGFRFFYDREAKVFHEGGTSSSSAFKTRQVFANLPVVVFKNIPRELLWRVFPRFLLAYLLFFGYKILQGQAWSALRGIGRSVRFWPHILSERLKVQRAFSRKFPTKNSRKTQLQAIEKLMSRKLPFRQVQRVKNLFSKEKSA